MNKRLLLSMLCLAVFAASFHVSASTWQKKEAPLMTTWGENIDPENVLPEYPRPQMQRDGNWINLNGVWDFEKISGTLGEYNPDQIYSQAILVPFPVESALSGIMDTDYPNNVDKVFLYKRNFTLSPSMQGRQILLHFGAVDWECEVFVNGTSVGTHRGGYDPFTFNITDALKAEGEQEIQVQVNDKGDAGGQPKGKQVLYPGGIYYTPASGIWQTVWLEAVDEVYIDDFLILPDVDNSSVTISISAQGATEETEVIVSLLTQQGELITKTREKITKDITISIPDAKLWTPDSPYLYGLKFEVLHGAWSVDYVFSYFGMRKISRGMVDGYPALLLNNEPLFQYGVLDQGYWPDGIYTAPSDEALMFDLIKTKELGMNMTRKHVKTEPARWYFHCDRLGLLVWQDIPSALEGGSLGSKSSLQENFYRETENIIHALKNHPSIVAWVIFNEGWGQDNITDVHTRKGIEVAQRLDKTRLINGVSGWVDYEIGDILDSHNYPNPAIRANPINERVSVCGEYGGITLAVEDHMWKGNGHQYVSVENSEELKNLFITYVEQVQGLQQSGIWGAIYTQITDVEEEINGLITYDRKVVKVNDEQIAAIREAVEQTLKLRKIALLPAGDITDESFWKYTTSGSVGEGWNATGYDDSSWAWGAAGFGAGDPPNTFIRTPWSSTGNIHLRKTFQIEELSEEALKNIRLWVYYDEDCEIYINGVLAASTTGYVTSYQLLTISDDALATIKFNEENLIAVKCKDDWGGRYIDVGITTEVGMESLTVQDLPAPPEEPVYTPQDSVYFMSYFKGNTQKLHYAYSYDGLQWEDINLSEPVFNAYDNGIAIRDPYVKRVTHKGETKFHMVHTMGWDNQAIFHWESDDLITWTAANGGTTTEDGKIYVMDGKNGNLESVNAWAPEFTYDRKTETFYIYWSSSSDPYMKHHYCTTQDWITFTPSKVYFDPGFSAIDMTVLEYDGMYYAYYKDERWGQKKTRIATSSSLDPEVEPFRGTREVLSGAYTIEVEGPEVFRAIGEDRWYLYWDKFNGDQGISFATTVDPASHKWYQVSDALVQNATGVKHGSVEIISKEELDKVLEVFYKERSVILPIATIEPQEWKYAHSATRFAWYRLDYDDSDWETGLSGFGRGDIGGGVVSTPWNTSNIYLRKWIDIGELTPYELDNLQVVIYHDDDASVYINGQLAVSASGSSGQYVRKDISKLAKESIVQNGSNLIAVSCLELGGVQYIDLGLEIIKDPNGVSIDKEILDKEKFSIWYSDLEQNLCIAPDEKLKGVKIQLTDMSGRTVLGTTAKFVTSLASLSAGVYIVTLSKDNVRLQSEYILKKN